MLGLVLITSASHAGSHLEFGVGTGLPIEVIGIDPQASLGGLAGWYIQTGSRGEIGPTFIYNRFEDRSDNEHATVSGFGFGFRYGLLLKPKFSIMGHITPTYYTRDRTFSEAAQQNNYLIPSSTTSSGLGFGFGTTLVYSFNQGGVRLFSDQSLTSVFSEHFTDRYLLLTLGLGIPLGKTR